MTGSNVLKSFNPLLTVVISNPEKEPSHETHSSTQTSEGTVISQDVEFSAWILDGRMPLSREAIMPRIKG